MQPKVSIVMPCYNKVEYIGNMFDSILAQKWDNIELILVNDGSTDGTREVISEYIPKFAERGFEAVVIDQENKGQPSAVYEGLKCASGEFVCQVDADDELDVEYVRVLAGHLHQNSSCDWVVCDADNPLLNWNSGGPLMGRTSQTAEGEHPYLLIASYLLQRIAPTVVTYMFRRSYMCTCGMLENFPTEPRVAQEPQIFFPLALGGARPFYIRKPLYRYIKRECSLMTSQDSYEKSQFYFSGYNCLLKATLSHLTTDKRLNGPMLQVGKLIREHNAMILYPQHDEGKQASTLARVVNGSGLLKQEINETEAQRSGFEPLARYFSNIAIGYEPSVAHIKRKPSGRIIAYAAFGKAASQVRRGLLNSDIRPDIFWDIAAKPEDSVDGIQVTLPDFESLQESDIVLILLRDVVIAKLVTEKLTVKLPKDNIFYFYDVIDYLAEYFYGGGDGEN